MKSAYRKQTRDDFQRRVSRLDPEYARYGMAGRRVDATRSRPGMAVLGGFATAYLVISVAGNRGTLESSLAQGSLAADHQDMVMMGLSAMLATAAVILMFHLVRAFLARKGGKRTNSHSLLAGVIGALVLVYTPATVWQAGFGMLDDNSQTFLMAASTGMQDTLPSLNFGDVAFVSSIGR